MNRDSSMKGTLHDGHDVVPRKMPKLLGTEQKEPEKGSATLTSSGHAYQNFTNSTINIAAGNFILIRSPPNYGGEQIRETATKIEHTPTDGDLRMSHSAERYASLAVGDHVQQTFNKSCMNVGGGDQYNTNITIYQTEDVVKYEADGNTSGCHDGKKKNAMGTGNSPVLNPKDHSVNVKLIEKITDNNCDNLVKVVNGNTREMTSDHILGDFKQDELQEPDLIVYPQMRKVDVTSFYKGRYGVNDTDGISKFGRSRNQLSRESGFYQQYLDTDEAINIDELMASIWKRVEVGPDNVTGFTAIVASAGSGKSTLTRRIARRALNTSSVAEYGKQKMIRYIELKDIAEEKPIKPSKFLFGGLFNCKAKEDQTFEWLVKNQLMAVLIFDGLDQARWDFDANNITKINNFSRASTSIIMYNILARNILPYVRVIVTSREFKVSELPVWARPGAIIALNGFTHKDAKTLFTSLLGENGVELWLAMETFSQPMLELVSVPVFLILTAIVMGRDPTRPPPSTVTELYNRIISNLQSIENIRNREQIFAIINKLKAMAFHGMAEKRVVFTDVDLQQFQVSTKEVQDLMSKIPGHNLLSRHLMEGDFKFFFCHQSIQEFLAASFVAEMNAPVFSHFVAKNLHHEQWFVVRRFVVEIVFLESRNDLHKVSDQTEKQEILTRSIISKLKEVEIDDYKTYVRIDFYCMIYESGNNELMKNLSTINVSRIRLTRGQAHIVGHLIAMSGGLQILDLSLCGGNDEILKIITKPLKDRYRDTMLDNSHVTSSIQINEVDLSRSDFSAEAIGSFLGFRSEPRFSNFDWNVAKLRYYEYMNKQGSFVEIAADEVYSSRDDFLCPKGRFNMKESILEFLSVPDLQTVRYHSILLDPQFIRIPDQQLHVFEGDVMNLSSVKIGKICTMLLDGTRTAHLDWRLIKDSVEKYEVELLDIAVNGRISTKEYGDILMSANEITGCGHRVNIHWLFLVSEKDGVQRIIEDCQQMKIGCIRCVIRYRASLDEILLLVINCKTLTLVYQDQIDYDMLTENGWEKVKEMAKDAGTELEILLPKRDHDAWWCVDAMQQ